MNMNLTQKHLNYLGLVRKYDYLKVMPKNWYGSPLEFLQIEEIPPYYRFGVFGIEGMFTLKEKRRVGCELIRNTPTSMDGKTTWNLFDPKEQGVVIATEKWLRGEISHKELEKEENEGELWTEDVECWAGMTASMAVWTQLNKDRIEPHIQEWDEVADKIRKDQLQLIIEVLKEV